MLQTEPTHDKVGNVNELGNQKRCLWRQGVDFCSSISSARCLIVVCSCLVGENALNATFSRNGVHGAFCDFFRDHWRRVRFGLRPHQANMSREASRKRKDAITRRKRYNGFAFRRRCRQPTQNSDLLLACSCVRSASTFCFVAERVW